MEKIFVLRRKKFGRVDYFKPIRWGETVLCEMVKYCVIPFKKISYAVLGNKYFTIWITTICAIDLRLKYFVTSILHKIKVILIVSYNCHGHRGLRQRWPTLMASERHFKQNMLIKISVFNFFKIQIIFLDVVERFDNVFLYLGLDNFLSILNIFVSGVTL